MSKLRQLPSVHALLAEDRLSSAATSFGREAVVEAVRNTLAEVRRTLKNGHAALSRDELIAQVQQRLALRPALYRPVLNATGVLLHTNLGRSMIADAAWQAMARARGICDLELDLGTGKRASRSRNIEEPLTSLTGGEAALVVNNNASAVLLALAALAGKKPTVVSRGHLVEIGGGFRLPTIMGASGSPLLEVGTTNRTNLADYAAGLDHGGALILLVHHSNFTMTGYVSEPTMEEVVALAHERNVPAVLDLGSGALLDTTEFGLPEELTVQKAVKIGFDAVCFSGDKLMGGPQAGVVVGGELAVEVMHRHPLARALRCDKCQMAGVLATAELFRRGEARQQIPLWQMLAAPVEQLQQRAGQWREALGKGEVIEAPGEVGGGCLPEAKIPGLALAVDGPDPDAMMGALRSVEPPIIGHISHGRVLLHPRSVFCEDDKSMQSALAAFGQKPVFGAK